MPKSQPEVVDLFCGVGALSHGLKLAGCKIIAGYDVDSRCNRIASRQVAPNLAQTGHGGPDLTGLPQDSHLNHQDVLLVSQLELHQQIRGLGADARRGGFFPGLRLRKHLPQALGHLTPNVP